MRVRPFSGKAPRFGARVFVASTAAVAGDVELGDDVNIWYGAVLRADLQEIRIGARTNIQDNVVLHVDAPDAPTVVGEDVTVGHAAILHGCRVERGALIGMHATVLNDAVIGEEAIVAAGALVPPGMDVAAAHAGGRGAGQGAARAHDEELEHMRRGVRVYLELKSRYLAADDERERRRPRRLGEAA